MKNSKWKLVIQILISILTALGTSVGVSSCMTCATVVSGTDRHVAPPARLSARHRLPLRHPTRRNARNGTTGIYGGGTLPGTQQILDRCVLRGRTRRRRTACRHSHRGATTGSEAAAPGTETALPPRPHRRPSRPEPHEGLSLL